MLLRVVQADVQVEYFLRQSVLWGDDGASRERDLWAGSEMGGGTTEQFVGVALRLAAEFTTVVGQDGADPHAEVLVERQDAIVD